MSKAGFSIADLQSGSKNLNPVAESKQGHSSATEAALDEAAVRNLEQLYNRFDGDLDLIFAELRADPTKAKKPHNRPSSAHEFATKYLRGFYTIVTDTAADSKGHK